VYKVQKVQIAGFWNRFGVECQFNENVNILIGKNGTGKTTFMDILNSVLTVDLEGISANDFASVEIILVSGESKKTIRARKLNSEVDPFPIFEYQISQKKYRIRLITFDDKRMSINYRRRIQEELTEIRSALDQLVSVSSLSVYRLRSGDEYEIRDRHGSMIVSPVDYRLNEALKALTHYQLALSQKAREIAAKLQKDVLTSILFGEEDAKQPVYALDFNKEKERSSLISAYTQLNAIDSEVRKKIAFHINAMDSAIQDIPSYLKKDKEIREKKPFAEAIRSLEALRKSRKIIEMSLEAEGETKKTFSQVNLFLEIVRKFISDKEFDFENGDLVISNRHGKITYSRLSSGEKQLLILLIEALLQNQKPHIYLADEPELSLHIEWQRSIIPAIRNLNPSAQVIAATHSPEVAANFGEFIIDMGEIICGEA
jgi:predicted ATPase